MGQKRDIYMHGDIPFNVPSWQTSRPSKRVLPSLMYKRFLNEYEPWVEYSPDNRLALKRLWNEN